MSFVKQGEEQSVYSVVLFCMLYCISFVILTDPFFLSFTCLSEWDVTRKVASKANVIDICLLTIECNRIFVCNLMDVSRSHVLSSDTSCAVA